MTTAPRPRGIRTGFRAAVRIRALVPALALPLALALGVAACGGSGGQGSPAASASAGAVSPGAPLTSPVDGQLVAIDAEGLSKVKGFTLRLADGSQVPFTIGVLENGSQFPPGHLAEHMATGTQVRISFHDEGGQHVVYRLDDVPAQ